MKKQKLETCVECTAKTGNYGEDSLYMENEETGETEGPLCRGCFDMLSGVDIEDEC